MSPSDYTYDPIPDDVYDQAFADLNQLQTQLPEEAVVSLAREVLDRLARQLKETKSLDTTVNDLCEALIGKNAQTASSIIKQNVKDGADFNALYLEHLAPAAKMLGDWWNADRISFAQVTVGTGRIYAIMRSLNSRMIPNYIPDQKSAFFAATPGDDHTLGVKMAGDLARKRGWQIDVELDGTHDQLIEQMVEGNHLLIGLSGAGIHSLPNLAKLVMAIRVSIPNARILVSGNVIRAAEESVRLMHVDGIGRDFDGAMKELARLWTSLLPKPK